MVLAIDRFMAALWLPFNDGYSFAGDFEFAVRLHLTRVERRRPLPHGGRIGHLLLLQSPLHCLGALCYARKAPSPIPGYGSRYFR